MNLDRIKSTIRAMLNLAADSDATDGEKQNAMRKVTEMMDQNNLREEDLADADGVLDSLDNVEVGHAKVDLGLRMCHWQSALCVWVERLLGTIKTYAVKQQDGAHCIFYGVLSDCEIATEIYYEVRNYIETECLKQYGGTKRGDGYSYCLGFVTGLQEQLKRAKAADVPPTKNALVVQRNAIVVKKQSLAERYAKDNKLKLYKQTKRAKVSNNDAFANGFENGSKYSVNTDRRKKLTA